MSKISTFENNLIKRYPPNNRFINGAFSEQVVIPIRKDEFGESIVDKESYRLSLTSKRGSIGTGSSYIGQYMFQDGKYNPDIDFSYILRKDLSIVEIDNYIDKLTKQQENANEVLKKQINEQIDAALDKRNQLKSNENVESDSNSSE